MSEVNDFKDLIIWQKGMDIAEKPKTLNCVGWVDEGNPTFSSICWVSQSLNPTYNDFCSLFPVPCSLYQ